MANPDYSQLISAITQATQNESESNPWLLGAQVLSQTQIPQQLYTDNPWGAVALGAAKGFLGGAGQAYGTNQVREYQRGLGAELPGYFQSQLADKPGYLATSKYLKDVSPALAISDENIARSDALDSENFKQSLLLSAAKDSPKLARELLKAQGIELPETQKLPIVGSPGGNAINFGITPISDRIQIGANQLVEQGYPPGVALEMAQKQFSPQIDRAKQVYKASAATTEQNKALDSMIQSAEAGITKAGNTGSTWANTGTNILATLNPYLKSSLNPEGPFSQSETEAAGLAQLAQAKQGGLGLSKVPGMGSMSDFETKNAFAAVPSPDKPAETNRALLIKFKNVRALNDVYDLFMNQVLEQTGDVGHAQSLWELYKKDSGLVKVENGDTKIDLNALQRKPMAQYPWGEEYQKLLGGQRTLDKPIQEGSTGTNEWGVPGKVISVKKIR